MFTNTEKLTKMMLFSVDNYLAIIYNFFRDAFIKKTESISEIYEKMRDILCWN